MTRHEANRRSGDQEIGSERPTGVKEIRRPGGKNRTGSGAAGSQSLQLPARFPREMVLARIMLRCSLMDFTDEQINCIVEKIIGCGIEVHREFGPGLLESVYRECFGIELKNAELDFEVERQFPLKYKGMPIKSRFQVDFVVEDAVIVELKSIEAVHPTSRKS